VRGHEYPIYSGAAPSSKRGVYGLLAVFAAVLVSGLQALGAWGARELLPDDREYARVMILLGSIAPLGVFGLLVFGFNRWGWRQKWLAPFFTLAGATQPAVLHGRYEGRVTRRPSGKGGPTPPPEDWPVVAVISQSWEQISVSFVFTNPPVGERAESHSDMAVLKILEQGEVDLQYTYRHERELKGGHGQHPGRHDGTSTMKFTRAEGGWTVTGRYYSEDASTGEIHLKQVPENPLQDRPGAG